MNSNETPAPLRGAGVQDLPISNRTKALRWAMWQIRTEVQGWGLPPPRREILLRGLGNALWRVLRKGMVRTTAALRRLLHELLRHLREAPEGVSASLKRACGYAGAIVLLALRALNRGHSPAVFRRWNTAADRTELLRRKLADLRRLYTAPWLSDEDRARIAEEGRLIREILESVCGQISGMGRHSTLRDGNLKGLPTE